jgi:hypothetical protein
MSKESAFMFAPSRRHVLPFSQLPSPRIARRWAAHVAVSSPLPRTSASPSPGCRGVSNLGVGLPTFLWVALPRCSLPLVFVGDLTAASTPLRRCGFRTRCWARRFTVVAVLCIGIDISSSFWRCAACLIGRSLSLCPPGPCWI